MTLFHDIETMLNLEVSASNFQDVHKRAGLSREEKELHGSLWTASASTLRTSSFVMNFILSVNFPRARSSGV